MKEPCQVCIELQRAGIDVPCSLCDGTDGRPLTLDEVKAALRVGAAQRKAYERTLKRSPRR